jgi:hypothetical protein
MEPNSTVLDQSSIVVADSVPVLLNPRMDVRPTQEAFTHWLWHGVDKPQFVIDQKQALEDLGVDTSGVRVVKRSVEHSRILSYVRQLKHLKASNR